MRRFYQYNVRVTAELDLNLYPLYRIKGQEWPQIPGLVGANPPRHTGRGREDDHLMIFLALSGNLPFSSAEYNQLMGELVAKYYKTPGSLTTAIRVIADALNQFLLNRNMRTTSKGQYLIGRMILGILRERQFTFAQCGPTHVFHLGREGTRQVHDQQVSGRGLGVAQATPLHLAQIDLHTGDLLVLCSDLPAGWDTLLQNEHRTSPEALKRKLAALNVDDFNAVLMQVHSGHGDVNILKWVERGPELAAGVSINPAQAGAASTGKPAQGQQNAASTSVPARPASSRIVSGRPASRFARAMQGTAAAPIEPTTGPKQDDNPPKPPRAEESATGQPAVRRPTPISTAQQQARTTGVKSPAFRPVRGQGRFATPRGPADIPEIRRPLSPRKRQAYQGAASFIQRSRQFSQKLSTGIKNFLPNLLPGLREGSGSSSSMIILAILIPVIIVVVASSVYINYGRTNQYQQYYQQAFTQAEQARQLTDPVDVRRAWDTTIYYLDLAEKNQKTQQSQDLRQEAQTALDGLDGITRLDFSRAIIGTLSHTVEISRMAATDTDIYLLDASRGDVIRAFSTVSGYQVDSSFQCEPGQTSDENGNPITVGPLVDILALPLSNVYNARILAMDSNGILLYCGLNDPVAAALVRPQLGWHSLTAFTLDADGRHLYVLDPQGNALWEYSGNQGKWTDLPIIFFGEQVPREMNNVIDLAANNSDMYLLFQDGHVTACPLWRFDVVPMRCTDPVTYVDTRPERQSGTQITDAIFTQVAFASAPDPSLYMLEPLTRAIYRFSPRSDSLELRGQFRASMESDSLITGTATAMTIGPTRYVFIGIGNQVWYATDVP